MAYLPLPPTGRLPSSRQLCEVGQAATLASFWTSCSHFQLVAKSCRFFIYNVAKLRSFLSVSLAKSPARAVGCRLLFCPSVFALGPPRFHGELCCQNPLPLLQLRPRDPFLPYPPAVSSFIRYKLLALTSWPLLPFISFPSFHIRSLPSNVGPPPPALRKSPVFLRDRAFALRLPPVPGTTPPIAPAMLRLLPSLNPNSRRSFSKKPLVRCNSPDSGSNLNYSRTCSFYQLWLA